MKAVCETQTQPSSPAPSPSQGRVKADRTLLAFVQGQRCHK